MGFLLTSFFPGFWSIICFLDTLSCKFFAFFLAFHSWTNLLQYFCLSHCLQKLCPSNALWSLDHYTDIQCFAKLFLHSFFCFFSSCATASLPDYNHLCKSWSWKILWVHSCCSRCSKDGRNLWRPLFSHFLSLEKCFASKCKLPCEDAVLIRIIWEKNPWYMLASGDSWETTSWLWERL